MTTSTRSWAGKGSSGRRDQGAALALEGLAHGDRAVVRPRAVGGDAVAPVLGLGVQVVDVAPGACGEEVVANIADGAFHAPLLVAAGDRDRPGQEQVVAGEGEELRVEPDGVAVALRHDALEIVVPEPRAARPAMPRRRRRGRAGSCSCRRRGRSAGRPAASSSAPSRSPSGGAPRGRSSRCRSGPSRPGPARREGS